MDSKRARKKKHPKVLYINPAELNN